MAIRLLIAEDFDVLREDLCEMLSRQEDMEVVGAAASGREISASSRQISRVFMVVFFRLEVIFSVQGSQAFLEPALQVFYLARVVRRASALAVPASPFALAGARFLQLRAVVLEAL